MAPYVPQSPDTSEEADRKMMELYRAMSGPEKIRKVMELNRLANRMALAGIREQYPDADERELRLRLAVRKYGRELIKEAYGWVPDGA